MVKNKKMKVGDNSTKKNESKRITKDQVQIDPSMYGYREGQKIEIDANYLFLLLSFASQVSLKERNIFYTPKKTAEETLTTAEEKITDLGLQATRIIEAITYKHIENAKNGIAVHVDVLKNEKDMFKEIVKKYKKD